MSALSRSDQMVLSQLSQSQRLPALSRLLVGAAWVLLLWSHRHRTRRDLRYLDPHLLRDVGLTQDDARIEAQKPFWRP